MSKKDEKKGADLLDGDVEDPMALDPLLDPPVDPEERELRSDVRKARAEEALVRTHKRTAKAKRELTRIEGADDGPDGTDGTDGYTTDFNEVVSEHGHRVWVRRTSGLKWKGHKLQQSCGAFDCPTTFRQVEADIEREFGGGRYKLDVHDAQGRFRTSRSIYVPGDPRIVDEDEDGEDYNDGNFRMQVPGSTPWNGGEDDEEAAIQKEIRLTKLRRDLDRAKGEDKPEVDIDAAIDRAVNAATSPLMKRIEEQDERDRLRSEVEPLKQQIDSLSRQLEGGGRRTEEDETVRALKQQISGLESRLEESKLRDLESKMDGRFDVLLQKVDAAGKGSGSNDLVEMAKVFKAMDNQNEGQLATFAGSMKEAFTGQVNQMQSIVTSLMAQKDPGGKTNELKDLAETLVSVGGILGMGVAKEPEDFGVALVNGIKEVVPQVLGEMRDGREAMMSGTQEQMAGLAAKMSKEITRNVVQRLGTGQPEQPPAQQAAVMTPAGPQAAPPPTPVAPARPHVSAQEGGASPAPPPPPTSGPPPATAPVPAAAAAPAPATEDDRANSVNHVLGVLIREMGQKPEQVGWPWAAWTVLPKDVLKKLVYAQSDEDVYEAVKDDGDITSLDALWAMIKDKEDPAHRANRSWMAGGINVIKGWARDVQEGRQPGAATGDAGTTA